MRLTTGGFGSVFLGAVLLSPLPSWALWEDKLELFAQENITYDSNVFRISGKIDPNLAINSGGKSDTIFTTAVGFNLDVPWSLQRLQVSFAYLDSRYRNFTDLDHRGHVGSAAYLWAITPRLTGELGYREQQDLASFANIQGRRPDLVTARMAYANAAWMATPSWRVHGAADANQTSHSDFRELQDLESASVETGLSYVTAQENRIGVAIRGERGRSPEGTEILGIPFDNKYTQEGIGVQGRWVLTGHSRLDGRLDYTRRRYDQFTERNYSGPTFRATYIWTPTGKITVATVLSRDVAPLQDITSTFVLVTGITVRPDWQVTDKISVRGQLAYAKWDYRGDPTLGLDFEHKVKNAGISVLYRPFTRVAISGALTHEERTSTLANADYKVDTASIEARIGF